nr:hypothetical protein [Tanacetum cinerariifolium]
MVCLKLLLQCGSRGYVHGAEVIVDASKHVHGRLRRFNVLPDLLRTLIHQHQCNCGWIKFPDRVAQEQMDVSGDGGET